MSGGGSDYTDRHEESRDRERQSKLLLEAVVRATEALVTARTALVEAERQLSPLREAAKDAETKLATAIRQAAQAMPR